MYDLLAGQRYGYGPKLPGQPLTYYCDVLQDCFLKAFTRIHDFDYREKGSLQAWMNRIIANESIDHLKRQIQHDLSRRDGRGDARR